MEERGRGEEKQRSPGLSRRPSEGGWPRRREAADHLNGPVGRAADRWREGEGTVVGRSSRRPSRQLSHMGFTVPRDTELEVEAGGRRGGGVRMEG